MRKPAVHMPTLRKRLCGADKMPRDFAGTFEGVELVSRYPDAQIGTFTVVVEPTPDFSGSAQPGRRWKRKSSQHRVFVVCTCKRLIPAGRLHQHKC